jgi:glycosyltransferase involved in cell wall biosynthesis
VKPPLLFLTPRDPFFEHGGDRLRARNLIAQLSRAFDVTVWFIGHEQPNQTEHTGASAVHGIAVGPRTRWRNALRGLFDRGQPLQVALHDAAAVHAAAIAGSDRFEIVFCHLIRMAPYLAHFKALKVIDFCDAVSENARQTAQRSPWWSVWGWVNALEAPRAQRYERSLASSFDLATVASEVDRQLLAIPRERCLVVPQGVSSVSRPVAITSAPVLLFLGKMDYFPNLNAVQWFCRYVMPLLPEFGLRVVGPISQQHRRQLEAMARVQVCGRVDDLTDAAQGCSFGIAPMQVATGIQNKVLDYLALGLPVLATTAAARGLPAGPDAAGLQIADAPADWARLACALLADQPRREQLRRQGLAYASEWHSWDRIGHNLIKRIGDVLEQQQAEHVAATQGDRG